MKTNEFSATIGTVAGYQGKDCLSQFKKQENNLEDIWQQKALEIYNQLGVYVSAVIVESKSVYNSEWGCPIGGEPTFTIEGSRNPEFCQNEEQWKDAVVEVVKLVKNHFNQSTVTLNFREVDQYYL